MSNSVLKMFVVVCVILVAVVGVWLTLKEQPPPQTPQQTPPPPPQPQPIRHPQTPPPPPPPPQPIRRPTCITDIGYSDHPDQIRGWYGDVFCRHVGGNPSYFACLTEKSAYDQTTGIQPNDPHDPYVVGFPGSC